MFKTINKSLTRDDLLCSANIGWNESFTVCWFDSQRTSREVREFGQAISRHGFSTPNDACFHENHTCSILYKPCVASPWLPSARSQSSLALGGSASRTSR